jgi:hypothetical protein
MKLSRFLIPLLLALFVSGCATLEVKTDYDPEYDFSTFKTYRWARADERNPEDVLVKNPLIQKRLTQSLDKVMKEKGLKKVERGDADLVVVMHAGTKEKVRVQQDTYAAPAYRGPYYRGWYDPFWGPYGGTTSVSYYTEGTLVIDLVSWKDKELVWRGMGTDTIKSYKDSAKQQRALDEAVAKIMADFPPN